MCGIAGIVASGSDPVRRPVEAMTRAMAHRGPDGEGAEVFRSGDWTLGLGHRRLAVIDLSPAGRQPMHDPERGNWITFNGEIYNFRELRRELESRGEVFRTRTDTEVILKAYGAWGKDCLARFRGIFAFALWDRAKRALLLARDQLGVKPLYLWQDGGNLLFASEVRAVLASGFVPKTIDPDGLLSYLAYGSVQEPFTLVRGIRSLSAGHLLEWSDGAFRLERYWRLPPPEAVRPISAKEASGELASLLEEVVESQLIADVPLGAFLSGGIDSTAIAALMKKKARGPVRTFSIVFDEKTYDERRWSRLAADRIGSEHSEVLLTGEDVRASIDCAMDSYDQPSADGLNTWFVSRAARKAGLTVSLSGVGGDELFGGYDGYRKALAAERIGKVAGAVPRALRSAAARVVAAVGRREAARKAAALLETKRHPYFVTRRLFDDRQIKALVGCAITRCSAWRQEALDPIGTESSGYDSISRASAFELQTYMRSTLLRDTDQMSMAHALEVRVPLIDHRLVEFLFTLPGRLRLDSALPKPLLTRSLNGLVPEECIHRLKRGFELPFQIWLKGALKDRIQESLEGLGAGVNHGPFSESGLRRLWESFEAGRVNWSRVWAVYVLQRWLRQHHLDNA